MTKKKFLLVLSFFLLLGVTLSTVNVRGHSPSGMSLSYNSNTDELTVSLTHSVSNPSTHYVFRVRIWVNASLTNTTLYTSQPTTSNFAYVYNDVVADIGATIQVTADCNQGGSITRSIIISGTNGQTDGDPTIPGYMGILAITIASIIITTFIILKKRKVYAISKNEI
jgi:hypothetical protein